MSYSSDLKAQIMGASFPSAPGRRAFLLGMLAAKGELSDGGIVLRTENEAGAACACGLIREFFRREATVSTAPAGGRCRLLLFSSPAATKYLTDILSEGELRAKDRFNTAIGAFFQGIYFACGRLCDPDKQYLLEFSCGDRAEMILREMEKHSVYPKITRRREEVLLCVRTLSGIQDFLMLAGMSDLGYQWVDLQVRKDYRNNANRFANCVTNNIEKAVNTAQKQLSVLQRLKDAGLLSSLPEELEKTARLRLEHPDLSMAQLAGLSVPPISKPGLCHRMDRLLSLAQELLLKNIG